MNNPATKIQADSPDQTTIILDGTRVEQFSDESVLLTIDNVGNGFSFNVPFVPGTKEYRDLFRPFKYQDVQLYIGGNLVLNGTVEKIAPTLTDISNSVNVQGRSKTGSLVDCTFEKDDTMEFKGAALDEIANSVASKFGLETSFPDGAGAIFEKAGPGSPTETIFNFLQNLSRQRSLLMSQTPNGKLLFRRAKTSGVPVAELIEGHQGIIVSTATYDSTRRFSSYDVFGQEAGKNDNFARLLAAISKKPIEPEPTASQDVTDPSIFAIRPKSIQANDTNQGNIADVATWAMTSDIAASIDIPLGYEGWLRPDGKLWAENELVLVQAPSIMIYKPYVMLIKSVNFISTADSKTVELGLTIPEAYSGEVPETYPWDE